MIDRYAIYATADLLRERYQLAETDAIAPRYNAVPTQQLPVITQAQKHKLSLYFWGTHPAWANNQSLSARLLSGKVEQLLTKKVLRSSLEKRRCLIPANGFYLWKPYAKKRKIPHYCFMPAEPIFSLAGLWEANEQIAGKTFYTYRMIETLNRMGAPEMGTMPAILAKEDEGKWLDTYTATEDLIELLSAEQRHPPLHYHSVASLLSNPEANHSGLMQPHRPMDQLGNYTLFELE